MLKRVCCTTELKVAEGCMLRVAGGMYELFAGRDASRSLATMSMTVSDKYDPLDDLSQNEREKLAHWEKQFSGRHLTIETKAAFISTPRIPERSLDV